MAAEWRAGDGSVDALVDSNGANRMDSYGIYGVLGALVATKLLLGTYLHIAILLRHLRRPRPGMLRDIADELRRPRFAAGVLHCVLFLLCVAVAVYLRVKFMPPGNWERWIWGTVIATVLIAGGILWSRDKEGDWLTAALQRLILGRERDEWLRWSKDRGKCPRCGYNLFGTVSDGCPECGWRIPQPLDRS